MARRAGDAGRDHAAAQLVSVSHRQDLVLVAHRAGAALGADGAETYGPQGSAVRPAGAALERARELAGPNGNVLVCGSLYLVGEILAQSS